MNWSQLIRQTGLADKWSGNPDPVITAIEEDSRRVKPGACFVASRGSQTDGHNFIPQALQAGASAIISEQPVELPDTVAGLCLLSTRGVAGLLARTLLGIDELQRNGRLKMVGVTGTNGKTTFCYLLRAVLYHAGMPTALLGTIQYDLLSRTIEAPMTTPPAVTLMNYLAEAVDAGALAAVMEVSSHALDQQRCAGVQFDVGVFSNFSGDHLDYHHDMTNYLQAKKKLFDNLEPQAVAIINADDPAGRDIVADCSARYIYFGIAGETDQRDDLNVYARLQECSADGIRFELIADPEILSANQSENRCVIITPLIGRFNVQNCLAASAAAIAMGVPLEAIASALSQVNGVPGRMQKVMPAGCEDCNSPENDFTVLVDYAHTDHALENALSTLRPLTKGRLTVLFGCGGDRDKTKRPRMAKVVADWADRIMVTSDNPRTEDPQQIINDILGGFSDQQRKKVQVQPDRRQAIRQVLAEAETGDVILVAGKGHETYQIIGTERLSFDDAAEAARALAELREKKITK